MRTISWLRDTAERAAATYAEALLSLLILAPSFSTLKAAAVAAAPAGLSVLKSALAGYLNPGQASLAPAKPAA